MNTSSSLPRFKKEEYLTNLSEDEFRNQVVRRLFFRLGYQDGRNICGPLEKGKDTIFVEVNKMGQSEVIAVLTKEGQLNMSSKASQNVASVIAQLQTVATTKIPFLKNKQKFLPSKVILCASGKINENARHHILDGVQDPRITFLDSDDLIPLLDEHLPELWIGVESDLVPYFNAIKDLVEGKSNRYGELVGPDKSILYGGATDSEFIALTLYRSGVKRKRVSGKTVNTPEFVELPITQIVHESYKKVLILGEAGSGKSTALLRIAYEEAKKGISTSGQYKIPILIKAIDLDRDQPSDFIGYIDNLTKTFARTQKAGFTHKDLVDGNLIVMVDALDEISGKERVEKLLNSIRHFSLSYPKVKLYVTSRPYSFIKEISFLNLFDHFVISPISWKQANKLVQNLQKGKKVPQKESKEILRRIEEVHGIELNPLLVSVFAATSEYSRQDIPANITELFKKFTELMLGRWDEKKGLDQQYQAPLKDFLLIKIAFIMHEKGKAAIRESDFRKIISDELSVRGHTAKEDQLVDEILNRSGLLRIVGENVEFRHHLLQEFFAGRGMPSDNYIKGVVHNEWWKRAIVFYFGQNPDKITSLKEIMLDASEKGRNALWVAATSVGLALQACYLSEVKDKLEVWKSVVMALAITFPENEKLVDAGIKYPIINFVNYYLYGRDSVALSHVVDYIDELIAWTKSTGSSDQEMDARMFWVIVSLIEIGEIGEARKLCAEYKPNDLRYLLAINMGCYLAKEVRELSDSQKGNAEDICKKIGKKIASLKEQLHNEFGSQLLEIRKGNIEKIDD